MSRSRFSVNRVTPVTFSVTAASVLQVTAVVFSVTFFHASAEILETKRLSPCLGENLVENFPQGFLSFCSRVRLTRQSLFLIVAVLSLLLLTTAFCSCGWRIRMSKRGGLRRAAKETTRYVGLYGVIFPCLRIFKAFPEAFE